MKPRAPALNVRWHDGRLVGRVVTTGPTHFAYDDEWLVGGHSLSPIAVPFADTAFRQRADGFDQLPGFLSDCLPDQWGRRLMDRAFSTLDLRPTPMRMLAWVGHRGIGTLNFEPVLDDEHSPSTPKSPLRLSAGPSSRKRPICRPTSSSVPRPSTPASRPCSRPRPRPNAASAGSFGNKANPGAGVA